MTHTLKAKLIQAAVAFVVTFLAVLALAMIYQGSAQAQASCDPGNWYDPTHQVCAPYPPPYSPRWDQPPSNSPYPPNHRPGYDQ